MSIVFAVKSETAGLKITAGQRTMSGLIVDLTGQTLVWPVILTGHLWIRTFYNIFHKLSLNAFCSVYNAIVTSFLFGFFFSLLCVKGFKEKKDTAINFMSSCRNETQQSETTTNCWSDATMQQVVLCFLLVLKSIV